ncbi:MAG: methyltransferase [Clostridiales bacterium]|jgi:16S rRNA (guanine1207-N2)-methyltransferase|nr:methyltransferase [Clostridiales bacterium]
MPHYFTNDGVGGKREYAFETRSAGVAMTLAATDGVFSKSAADEGTKYLIEAVLPLLAQGRRTLADLGCGYGIIGIAAAMARPQYRVIMADINEKAVELANVNAARNGVSPRAAAYVSDGVRALEIYKPVDYVLSNPPFRAGKQVVLRFFCEAFDILNGGGRFYTVLRKQQGAESYLRALAEIFDGYTVIFKKKGYVVAEAVRNDGVSTDNERG